MAKKEILDETFMDRFNKLDEEEQAKVIEELQQKKKQQKKKPHSGYVEPPTNPGSSAWD